MTVSALSRQGTARCSLPLLLFYYKAVYGLKNRTVGRLFGLSESTVRHRLRALRARVGARNEAHAAYLLWPVLGAMLAGAAGHKLVRQRQAQRGRLLGI